MVERKFRSGVGPGKGNPACLNAPRDRCGDEGTATGHLSRWSLVVAVGYSAAETNCSGSLESVVCLPFWLPMATTRHGVIVGSLLSSNWVHLVMGPQPGVGGSSPG